MMAAVGHEDRTTKRGMLLKALNNAETVRRGSGVARELTVAPSRVNEFLAWIDDARPLAYGNSEREGLRRLRLAASEQLIAA